MIAGIAAEWQEWGGWSGCTASCGEGSRVRARACSGGALFGGDRQCSGSSSEVGRCEISKCEGTVMLSIPCPTMLLLEISLQLKTPNGKHGAGGRNAVSPVVGELG